MLVEVGQLIFQTKEFDIIALSFVWKIKGRAVGRPVEVLPNRIEEGRRSGGIFVLAHPRRDLQGRMIGGIVLLAHGSMAVLLDHGDPAHRLFLHLSCQDFQNLVHDAHIRNRVLRN